MTILWFVLFSAFVLGFASSMFASNGMPFGIEFIYLMYGIQLSTSNILHFCLWLVVQSSPVALSQCFCSSLAQ